MRCNPRRYGLLTRHNSQWAKLSTGRRQLIRHSAWFGAAVGLAVAGGEVISHVAGTAEAK